MANHTEIVIILDKSGSMQSIRESVVIGINNLIEEVQKEPGEGYWTLVQFDDPVSARGAGEEFPHVIFENKPDKELPKLEMADFRPRGNTALIDALCITLNKMKKCYFEAPEEKRPRIMVVIVTDGEENRSTQFKTDDFRLLSAEVQTKLGWQFMYLGANQDVFRETEKYGIQASMNYAGLALGSTNALPMNYNAEGVRETLCSGSIGIRAWKADNNPTAEFLLSSAEFDLVKVNTSGSQIIGG